MLVKSNRNAGYAGIRRGNHPAWTILLSLIFAGKSAKEREEGKIAVFGIGKGFNFSPSYIQYSMTYYHPGSNFAFSL